MQFQEFAKQRKRMCEHYSASCRDEEGSICPMFFVLGHTCSIFCLHNPKEAEEIVSKWAAEHPSITNRQKLKEMFGVDIDDIPSGCSGIKCPEKFDVNCKVCPYRNFWDQEYKEVNP